MQKKVCPVCNNSFNVKKSHYDKRVHCSRKCLSIACQTKMKGENNPNFKTGLKDVICPTCGIYFKQKVVSQKYCSRSCVGRRPDNIIRLNKQSSAAGKLGGQPKGPPRLCPVCGQETGERWRKYCSVFCLKNSPLSTSRVDANQPEIIKAIENAGGLVLDASQVKGGFPDLIVAYKGNVYLIEIKNPETKHGLSLRQKEFHENWKGQIAIANSIDEALEIIGAVFYG